MDRPKTESPVPSRIERLCMDKGLKMTEQRRIIAQVLSESTDHPDVESVHRRSTEIDPRISIATVYRTVRLFEEANILNRHDFGIIAVGFDGLPVNTSSLVHVFLSHVRPTYPINGFDDAGAFRIGFDEFPKVLAQAFVLISETKRLPDLELPVFKIAA